MAVLADLIDEWHKLNGPAKIAVGGVGVAAALIIFSMHKGSGSATGVNQGDVLGNAASGGAFGTTASGTPPAASVPPGIPPVKPPGKTGGGKVTIPPIPVPIHKIKNIIIPPRTTSGTKTGGANGNGSTALRNVSNTLEKSVQHPIELIRPTAVGSRQVAQ